MYSYQGQNYTSLDEVPSDILTAFIQQNVLTETIAIQQNKILFWEEHYMRLMASMRILRMEIPLTFTMEHLAEKIQDITRHNVDNDFSGKVHLNVAKMAQPSFEQPIPKTAYSITVNPLEAPVFLYQKATQPIDLYKDHYLSTGLYHTIENAAAQWRAMAWTYVYENNYCDGILLNTDKHIIESLKGALFLVKGNKISTSALDQGCRKTVYRKQLLALLEKSSDYEVIEEAISPFSIQKADELFVLSDADGLYSIEQYRKKAFKTEYTEKIYSLFLAYINSQL